MANKVGLSSIDDFSPIDPIDGGPSVSAECDNLPIIKNVEQIEKILFESASPNGSFKDYLLGWEKDNEFFCIQTHGKKEQKKEFYLEQPRKNKLGKANKSTTARVI